ncbi:SDR family oxidoreductase [Vibrio vulnificus]|uniref:dTDP-4-dehydrorhamnose reductase family protein n=1 Tax=Vibrio vulnificus TaxID=672 RepID=UPI002895F8F2|nr:SDR family oxidoreductase [Vibrio vulnificus]ELH9600698.1 SDR family oxidoreductase [Vibrio vulnificus]ELH9615156.1 SDR family oxidoreductase [Vibrio vulnificus]
MKKKVLILGSNGMLGASLTRYLSRNENIAVYACVRNKENANIFNDISIRKITGLDILNEDNLEFTINNICPDVVINCTGIIKQKKEAKLHINSILINSLYPHKIAAICDKHNAKLIHFSTDCVFSGSEGMYNEDDIPDAKDLYGRSKLLGEVTYNRHLTIRTSIIGHENKEPVSLVDWFLNQKEVQGYSNAIFSGLPTVYVAEVLEKHILFNPLMEGLFNLSVNPIDKYTLLNIIREVYNHECKIKKDISFRINRSLDNKKIRALTGYEPIDWYELIGKMYEEYNSYFK